MIDRVIRFFLATVLALAFIPAAHAGPADIDAAARGVVRIIVFGEENGELYPVSHGTGFAVTPERIVTNAHVVEEARADTNLSIGIVPSDGGKAVYGKIAAFSSRNDLALVATTSNMNLPPLTLAGDANSDSGPITSVGYPMNVDRAQGLGIRDIFNAQPPVKSNGFLSGRRPSRDFDTLLHTAPIGRGSSGGPLLDDCGRVMGVNSFGAESDGTDSEFYFAVSNRELLPFLRANDITAQVNGLPCRSMAELDQAERARAEREQVAAQARSDLEQQRLAQSEGKALRQAEFNIITERENAIMLTLLLLGCAAGAAHFVRYEYEKGEKAAMKVAAAAGVIAVVAAIATWVMRPSFDEAQDRASAALAAEAEQTRDSGTGVIDAPAATAGTSTLTCVADVERSRITNSDTKDVPFTWTKDGCVNSRTQYGLMDGKWSRILVPSDEAAVSVNTYDPAKGEYRVERFLLGNDAMTEARKTRETYKAPACGTGRSGALALGTSQAAIFALLPAQPNERLVFDCSNGKK